MNREQYLCAIREALNEADIDKELSREILSDYEEHFEIGLQKGKTQEQLCEELGSIDEILQEISSMKQGDITRNVMTQGEPKMEGNEQVKLKPLQCMKAGQEHANYTSVSRDTDSNEIVTQMSKEDQSQAGKEKPDFTRVEVEGPCVDVYVRRGDCFKVDYENRGNSKAKLMYQFYHYQQGDTLYCGVKENYTKTFLRILRNVDIVLNIQVPNFVSELKIHLASGDMEVRDQKLKMLSLHSASGDIELSSSDMVECMCNSCSGDLTLEACNMDILHAKTSSGDIDVQGGNIRVLNANSTSGDVSCTSITKEYNLKSVSGDVQVSSFGDIRGNFESISGDAEIRLNNDGNGYKLSLSTISGDMEIRYQGVNEWECSKGTYTFGNQGSELQIRTVSGDIQLRG